MMYPVLETMRLPPPDGAGEVLRPHSELSCSNTRGVSAAVRYLHGIFAGLREERLHVVFFDKRQRYLHDRTMMIGGPGQVTLRARYLLQEAFAIGAHGIVLAHNHLSGVCRPSEADIASTQRLVALCREVDIDLLDHFIFTAERGFSMRVGGYL